MYTVSKSMSIYAEGGAVGIIDDTSDWLSSFFDFYAFFVFGSFYFLVGVLEAAFEGDFSLLLDFDLSDLLPSAFFLLLESGIQTDFQIIY